jgi:hypothetical protein
MELCVADGGLSSRLPTTADPEAYLAALQHELMAVARLTVPEKKILPRSQSSPPWFNLSCAEAWLNQKNAFRLRRQVQLELDWQTRLPQANSLLRSMRKKFKATVAKAKASFITRSLNQAKHDHRLWDLYSVLAGKKKRKVESLILEGDTVTDPGLIAQALLDGFRGNFSRPESAGMAAAGEGDSEAVPDSAFLSIPKAFTLLRRLHRRKAMGPDGLPSSLLKALAGPLAAPVSRLVNLTISSQTVPSPWKDAWVTPVPKASSPCQPHHYRPISLLPALSKVFEAHLLQLLQDHLGNPQLPSHELGFQPRTGCQDALLCLQQKVMELAQASRKPVKVAIVSFDLAKAFDRLPHETVLQELRRRECPHWLLRLCRSWLCGRRMRVRVEGAESEWFHLPSSCPQGSLSGPFFFILSLSRVSEAPFSPGTYLGLYADDATLVCDVSTPEGEARLRRDVNLYAQQIKDLGLSLNPSKSKLLVVGFSPNLALSAPLTVHGVEICAVPSVRILGITFDRRLSFAPHFFRIASSAKAATGAIARLVRRDPEALDFILKQRIVPLLLFSISCALPGTSAAWAALNRVPSYASRLITNDWTSSSRDVRQAAGLPSASELAVEAVALFTYASLYKGRRYGQWLAKEEAPDQRSQTRDSLRSSQHRHLLLKQDEPTGRSSLGVRHVHRGTACAFVNRYDELFAQGALRAPPSALRAENCQLDVAGDAGDRLVRVLAVPGAGEEARFARFLARGALRAPHSTCVHSQICAV